jgi:hypothetical protein
MVSQQQTSTPELPEQIMSPTGVKKFRSIPKPLGLRIQELLQSLQVVHDATAAARSGKLYHLLPLYGQMRTLLTERSKGNQPLLLDLASIVGQELRLYTMHGADDPKFPEGLQQGLVLHLAGFPVSLRPELPAQIEMALADFVDQKIVLYKGVHYTARDIIELLANKAGGSHFPASYPEDFAELMQFGIGGQPMLANALMQIGQVTLALGIRLLRQLTDFELHLLAVIPAQPVKSRKFILDSRYPETLMAVQIRVEPGNRVAFGLRGIDGTQAQLVNTTLIDWSTPHHLAVGLHLTDELESELSLFVDRSEAAHARIERPIFAVADPLDYDSYFNRSFESPSDGLRFGLVQLAAYGGEQSLLDRGAVYRYFNDRRPDLDAPCVFFSEGSFGHAPPGTKNMSMTGKVIRSNVRAVLENTVPLDRENN